MSSDSTEPRPSLRRVLAGYLRLRSPFNLILDGALLLLASDVISAGQRWAQAGGRTRPPDQFSGWWAANEVVYLITGMAFYGATALLAVGCARIIADRIAEGGKP